MIMAMHLGIIWASITRSHHLKEHKQCMEEIRRNPVSADRWFTGSVYTTAFAASHYLEGFNHSRWCDFCTIDSATLLHSIT
jgi:hypothetical protein